MPYTRVTRTRNGAAAIAYAVSGTGDNGAQNRNELVTPIRLHTKTAFAVQMEKHWCKARVNHKTQIIRIVQSFSKKEFDPHNPADILKANELGQAMVDEHYPDRQALVCTQTDGKGGCVHNHILVSDVSMTTGMGCTKEQYYQPILKGWTDEITARYTNLDKGEDTPEKLTQAERAKREKGECSYKDDIRRRVEGAMKKSVSEEDFIDKLLQNGIIATRKHSKKYGEYFTYELTDKSEIPEGTKLPNHALSARSYKLGTAYGVEALTKQLALYERVAERNEFTDYEPEVSFKKSTTAEEKTKTRVEETVEVHKNYSESVVPVNLMQQISETEEEQDETDTDIFSADNTETQEDIDTVHESYSEKTTPAPAPKRRVRKSRKAAPDFTRRSVQLGNSVNDISVENGKEDGRVER